MQANITREQTLRDIETLYQLALDEGKWHIALRAKEIQSKILGLFKPQHLPKIKRIADMTEEQLCEFITRLEESDPDLKSLESSSIENGMKDSSAVSS